MEGLLRIKILILILGVSLSVAQAQSNTWKPAMEGIRLTHSGNIGTVFHLEFKPKGPLGKDWIYGGYFDKDSKRRCVAYREGGKWVPLPFSGYKANMATDMEMYGDTLYISGGFANIILDKDSSSISNTSILKWYNDSLWSAPFHISIPADLVVKNDTLLIAGDTYINPPDTFETHFMTTNGGSDWQYPYSIIHPTENRAYFGADPGLEILPNGDILTINNGSPLGSPYRGLARWDGTQWHGYGNGLSGFTSRTFDFEFYRDELYMGGTFNKYNFPNDPANFIARWDGQQWQEVGGGTNGFVDDLFVYGSILYCKVDGGFAAHTFGDVTLPYFAGWDGTQWCGTPFNFGSPPGSFGIIKDTLYVTFVQPSTVDGAPVSYLNYYDGDFLKGPNAICSTPGIGQEETAVFAEALQVFPLPATDKIQVSLSDNTPIEFVEIYDVSGRQVVCITNTERTAHIGIDISNVKDGVYFIKVNNTYNARMVKN